MTVTLNQTASRLRVHALNIAKRDQRARDVLHVLTCLADMDVFAGHSGLCGGGGGKKRGDVRDARHTPFNPFSPKELVLLVQRETGCSFLPRESHRHVYLYPSTIRNVRFLFLFLQLGVS